MQNLISSVRVALAIAACTLDGWDVFPGSGRMADTVTIEKDLMDGWHHHIFLTARPDGNGFFWEGWYCVSMEQDDGEWSDSIELAWVVGDETLDAAIKNLLQDGEEGRQAAMG